MTLEQVLSAAEWQMLLGRSAGANLILDPDLRIVSARSSCPSLEPIDHAKLIGMPLVEAWGNWASKHFAASIGALQATLDQSRWTATSQSLSLDLLDETNPEAPRSRSFRVTDVPLFVGDRLAFIVHQEDELTELRSLVDRLRERRLGDETHHSDVSEPAARRIEHAGTEFERVRSELEQRLDARTADLQSANAQLLREIADHMKTDKALRHSQEQLQHAQKLEAVGRLAGGIAHDFNNLLSVILGYAGNMLDDLGPDAPMRADVSEIRQAGERAAALTRQLLAFSRRQVLKPEVVDLNAIILSMGQMLRRLVGEDIDLKVLPATSLWRVKVDPGQIEQVIMNLVVNARDAMPDGGTLTIETGCVELDEEYALTHLGVVAGPHVMLAISDTGTGMSREVQKRVFEPFFTTKDKGKGTGLGLSTVFGIVKQSDGHIWLYSEPQKGSCFKIFLPRTREQGEQPRPVEPRAHAVARDCETILLCEDEDQVRTLARKLLERRGYRVLEASRPLEAIEIARASDEPIELLITDVVMPQMGGRELARQLSVIRPTMKVLYMSGYTDNAVVHNGILETGLAFIQKPITPETFATRVRAILDEGESG